MTLRRKTQFTLACCWFVFAVSLLVAVDAAAQERWWFMLANFGIAIMNLELVSRNRRTLRVLDENL